MFVDVVRTDDRAVIATAVEYLHDLGHRNIAHIDGGRFRGAADRRRAYLQHMRRLGLADRIRVVPGDITEQAGMRAAENLLDSERLPTAVVTFNDRWAVGLMMGLRHAGVDVPGQVSIVGYDDVPMAALPYINLTTVGQDAPGTAKRAVDHAIARLEQTETTTREELVTPYLVVRETTSRTPDTAA